MKQSKAIVLALLIGLGLSQIFAQVSVAGRIVSNSNLFGGFEGAVISLTGTSAWEATSDEGGFFLFDNIPINQVYNYTVSSPGFTPTNGVVEVGTSNVYMGDIVLNEIAYPPHSVVAESIDNSIVGLHWQTPGPPTFGLNDDFESYEDFSLSFGDWTLVDVDQSPNYSYTDVSYPHSSESMSYMIFNPETTVPPISDLTAHSGSKFAASFGAMIPPNNDWLISPLVQGGGILSFWVKTYAPQYGLERFKVGVSTGGVSPQQFNIISGGTYLEAPAEWTQFQFSLDAYYGQNIRFGIRCVSNDAFIFMVDDVMVQVPIGYDVADNNTNSSDDRSRQGYKVWRLLSSDVNNEANWTLLTPNLITSNAFQDAGFGSLPGGTYKYAVRAVYSNNLLSVPAFSNSIITGVPGYLQGTVVDYETLVPIEGVTVQIGQYQSFTEPHGSYWMQLGSGTHSLTACKEGYLDFAQEAVTINPLETTTFDIRMLPERRPPRNFSNLVINRSIQLSWLPPDLSQVERRGKRSPSSAGRNTRLVLQGYRLFRNGEFLAEISDHNTTQYLDQNSALGTYSYALTAVYNTGESIEVSTTANVIQLYLPPLLSEGFEDYPDFALDFGDWNLVDVDNATSSGINGVSFPNSGGPMAFMIFNPSQTVPPLQNVYAYEGEKVAACFPPQTGASEDWIITHRLLLDDMSRIKFTAMSLDSGQDHGSFYLGVSTAENFESMEFVPISGANPVLIPQAWTTFDYNLAAYDNQEVYIGLKCLAATTTAVLIDDFLLYNNLFPEIEISLESHDFGTVYLGNQVQQEIVISNSGDDGLAITGIEINGSHMFSFSPSPSFPLHLNANENFTLTLTYNPTMIGTDQAVLKIYDNLSYDPHRVNLCGIASDLYPPRNLVYTNHSQLVNLDWEIPEQFENLTQALSSDRTASQQSRTEFLGYNIYRNGNLLAFLPGPETTEYMDIVLEFGTYSYGLTALYESGESIMLSFQTVVYPYYDTIYFEDSFEYYENFSTDIGYWEVLDLDQALTHTISGTNFPGQGEPMSFMVFNPHATVPPLTNFNPYQGSKMLACFAAVDTPNNDWLFSPVMVMNQYNQLSFLARSYSSDTLERLRVGISYTQSTNPDDYQIISGAEPIEVPASWTQFAYLLPGQQDQPLFIGFNCVSDSGFALFLDKVQHRSYVANDDDTLLQPKLGLLGNYPNPFNPSTTIRYYMEEAGPITLEIMNMKGQLVHRVNDSGLSAGEHSYVWDGRDNSGRSLASGLYFVKLTSGATSCTAKMLMMK